MSNKDFVEVGKRIEECRKSCGMTLDEVGQLLGMHRSSILRYENGCTKQIKLVVLERLAEIFKTTPEYLMTGYDNSSDSQDKESENNEEIQTATIVFGNTSVTYNIEPGNESTECLDDGYNSDSNSDDDTPMLSSPINYSAKPASNSLFGPDEIISQFASGKLPHLFSCLNTSEDFAHRIFLGDILTMSTCESTVDGSMYLFLTKDKQLIIRRVFHSSQGYSLTCDNPSVPPIIIPYIGKNSGYSLIARVVSLYVEFK